MRRGSHDDPVRPDGGKKRKKGQIVKRKPMYVPVSDDFKTENSIWLRRR
jgi:hypothetical protein